MLRDGFLRFCNDPEIACCKAEKELGQLRMENAQLRAQLHEAQRRERAAVEDINGLGRFEQERCAYCAYDNGCEPGEMRCRYLGDKAFEWRGPGDEEEQK